MVIFEPTAETSGAEKASAEKLSDQKMSSRGEIQPDGTFQLGTHTNNDGAAEGQYKVLIAPPPLPEEGKRLRSPIAAKYRSLDSTPLKFTVTKDRNKNRFNIEVD
jgi:hypothetical protein